MAQRYKIRSEKDITDEDLINIHRIGTVINVTVPTTGWTDNTTYYSITLPVTGILETDSPKIDVDLDGTESNYDEIMDNYDYILGATTSDNNITLNFLLIPTISFDIKVAI